MSDNAAKSLVSFLEKTEDKFISLNKGALNEVSFENECVYARQALLANEYLYGVASSNQQSLADAIYNVASIGISLNPAYSHAYLVPRKIGGARKVCLDISYRGLIKLATDTGIIQYMKAEIIHENDIFSYKGFDVKPELSTNPFKDRGDIVGCAAWAKLTSGDYLVELMTLDQLNTVRDDSEAYKGAVKKGENSYQYQNCVWVKYYGEMIKKTVIKRLAKTLPQSHGSQDRVIDQAIHVINEHEGSSFDNQQEKTIHYTDEQSSSYKSFIEANDYVALLCLVESLDSEAYIQLQDLHEYDNLEKGTKGRHTKMMEENLKIARSRREDTLSKLMECCANFDDSSACEIVSELSSYEFDFYQSKLNSEQTSFIGGLSC